METLAFALILWTVKYPRTQATVLDSTVQARCQSMLFSFATSADMTYKVTCSSVTY